MSMCIIMIGIINNGDFDLKSPIAKIKRYTVLATRVIGLAAYYAWARAKHFGCHSVCLSFCHHREVTFRSSNLNITCSTATSLSPLIGKVTFYCTFVSREPRKV